MPKPTDRQLREWVLKSKTVETTRSFGTTWPFGPAIGVTVPDDQYTVYVWEDKVGLDPFLRGKLLEAHFLELESPDANPLIDEAETRVALLEQALRDIRELLHIKGSDRIEQSLWDIQKALGIVDKVLKDEPPQ